MKDRVPLYPGRVKLTPVSGQENTYDMVRADEPTQEGTPLNKASLLTDATAALFGLGSDAVPDDVFSILSGLYNHCWKKTKSAYTGTYSEKTEDYGWMTYPIDIFDGTYDETGKTISLTKIGRITCKADYPENIVGKYIAPKSKSACPDYVWIVTEKKSITDIDASFSYVSLTGLVLIETAIEEYYAYSSDRNAYPDDGFVDGYEYQYLGVPFERIIMPHTRIDTGRYTGTGTYGSSNPNSLTFEFEPRVLFVVGGNYSALIYCHNGIGNYFSPVFGINASAAQGSSATMTGVYCNQVGNTIKWWATGTNMNYQLNRNDTTYHYVAIG